MLSAIMLSVIMLSVIMLNAECHNAECHNAECHYAESHYAECHYAERHFVECLCAECRGAHPSAVLIKGTLMSKMDPNISISLSLWVSTLSHILKMRTKTKIWQNFNKIKLNISFIPKYSLWRWHSGRALDNQLLG